MKKIYSSILLSCLVTFASSVSVYAQETEGMEQGDRTSCEQEAKEMGISDPQEVADYIKECESMTSGESMDDETGMSDSE